VPHSGPTVSRGHLRLASTPAPRRVERRAVLLVRAAGAALALLWLTAAAWISAALALAPLAWRRAPLGRRVRPIPPREARVIPFQPRRQALPR
jgi:hypothetical protein